MIFVMKTLKTSPPPHLLFSLICSFNNQRNQNREHFNARGFLFDLTSTRIINYEEDIKSEREREPKETTFSYLAQISLSTVLTSDMISLGISCSAVVIALSCKLSEGAIIELVLPLARTNTYTTPFMYVPNSRNSRYT